MTVARARDGYVVAVIVVIATLRRIGSPRLARAAAHLIGLAGFQRALRASASADGGARGLGLPRDAPAVRRVVKESSLTTWQNVLALAGPAVLRAELSAVHIEGQEHLDRALEAGRGVILWESSTFGRRVLAKLALASQGLRVVQVHADNHLEGLPGGYDRRDQTRLFRAILRPFFQRSERSFADEIVLLSDTNTSLAYVKTLSARLRENRILCSSAEGARGWRFVVVDLFGRPRPFATGMLSLARTSGAAILPLFCFRDERGALRLVIEEPLAVPRDRAGAEELVRLHARRLESYIRRYPGEYRDWHQLGVPPPGALGGQ
jgi:hypothetical protein